MPKPDESADSDFAPISPFADQPTKEEETKLKEEQRKRDFLKAVNVVSSASETDEETRAKNAKLISN